MKGKYYYYKTIFIFLYIPPISSLFDELLTCKNCSKKKLQIHGGLKFAVQAQGVVLCKQKIRTKFGITFF